MQYTAEIPKKTLANITFKKQLQKERVTIMQEILTNKINSSYSFLNQCAEKKILLI